MRIWPPTVAGPPAVLQGLDNLAVKFLKSHCCVRVSGAGHPHSHAHSSSQTSEPRFGMEVPAEWDVTDPARCRIWQSNPSIVLHIDLRVCAIPNCEWRLQRSQLLSTLHWTVLPESSLPNVQELINGFLLQKLSCFFFFLSRKVSLWKISFSLYSFQCKHTLFDVVLFERDFWINNRIKENRCVLTAVIILSAGHTL